MKPQFVAILVVLSTSAFSQNKTLGVGTTIPNPNAALHVESPTLNQGFIMPRLSTVQRNAMTSLPLAAVDDGLFVYDKDLKKLFVWDGASWQPASGLSFPYVATDASATASFSITNTASGRAASFLNSGTGLAGQFSISNAASTATVLDLTHTGNGNALTSNSTLFVNHGGNRNAGDFQISNPASTGRGINVMNAGTGAGIFSQSTGSGSAISAFNSNATNSNAALVAAHSGLGYAGHFTINNATSNTPTLFAETNGLGAAANLSLSNVGNSAPALLINHAGTGNAITANRPIQATSFVGDGSLLTNLPGLALPFSGTSSGAGVAFDVTNNNVGGAGSFSLSNAGNNSNVLTAGTAGTGSGLSISLTNGSNTSAAINILHGGTGNAITANRPIQATSFVGDGSLLTNLPGLALPFSGTSSGAGVAFDVTNNNVGGAGSFSLSNAGNSSNVLSAGTGGTGSGLSISLTNGSNTSPAINILHGGTGNAITANRPIQASAFIGDGSGLTNLPASGWGLGGNSGTVAGTNYIGTSDANELVFKSNNVEAMRIYTTGQIGIGSIPAAATLAVGSTTNTLGVYGDIQTVSAGQNKGVWGHAAGSTTQNFGVFGVANLAASNGAIGVYGEAQGTGTAAATGVYGSVNNFAVTSGVAMGVYGEAFGSSTANWAGYFGPGDVHITNALSVGGTAGTFGTSGQVLTSQGSGSAPIWSTVTPGANSVTNTEIVDGTIGSADLSSSINISTTGSVAAASFTGDGAGLTNLPASGWGLSGNTGTGNYLGTSDATDLSIRTNTVERISIASDGRVGINGVPSGNSQLTVGTTSYNHAGFFSNAFVTGGGQNKGVQADASNSNSGNFGVYATGYSNPGDGIGVYGEGVGTGTNTFGMMAGGLGTGTNTYGIRAEASGAANNTYAVYGTAFNGSASNWAGYFDQGDVHITNKISLGAPGSFGTSGQVLMSQGAATPAAWSSLDLSTNNPLQSVAVGGSTGSTLYANTVYVGYGAGFSNTAGAGNTFVGRHAGFSSVSGASNVFLGFDAGSTNVGGSNNVIIGAGGGTGVSGVAMTGGTGNILIGTNADLGVNNLTNAVAIGTGAVVSNNNTIMLGASGTSVSIGGATVGGTLSLSQDAATDPALNIGVSDPGNISPVINAGTFGDGNVLAATNWNASNASPVISITNNNAAGHALFTTSSISAGRYIASTTQSSSVVDIVQNGNGNAASFQVNNAGSPTSAVSAITNGIGAGINSTASGSGPALQLSHSSGLAIDMLNGSMRYSTTIVNGNGTITIRSGVYRVQSPATNVDLPSSAVEGETCLVANEIGGPLTVSSAGVANGTVRQFVYLGGTWRIIN